MEIENASSEEEVVLCGGLQYEGARQLLGAERESILDRLKSQRRRMILWLLGIPLCIAMPFISWSLLDSLAMEPTLMEDVLFISVIVLIIAGIPACLYYADVAFKRYRVLKRTSTAGELRRFRGRLSSDDWTSNTDFILRRAAALELEGDEDPYLLVDLHASDDVLFKINDRQIHEWIAVELTRAVRPPSAPARFKAPIEWLDPESEDDILRRRLTPGELDEILGYAKQMRRARWWKLFTAAWMVAFLSRLVGLKILELGFTGILGLWMVVTAVVCAALFFYRTSKAEQYDKDREDGWAVILGPEQVSTLSDGETTLSESIEVLPMSGSTWTIGGKPAGWRRRV